MPLWHIYHPPSTFNTDEAKAGLANSITNIYTSVNLPAFYVNVIFVPVEPSNYYIGGIQRPSPNKAAIGPGGDTEKPWIRITIQNIARKISTDAMRDRFLALVDTALKPHVADKGYDWEYSIEETSRDLWKMNGVVPPMPGSDAEKEWVRENKVVGYEKGRAGLL